MGEAPEAGDRQTRQRGRTPHPPVEDRDWQQTEQRSPVALAKRVMVTEMLGNDRGFDVPKVEPGQRYQLRA